VPALLLSDYDPGSRGKNNFPAGNLKPRKDKVIRHAGSPLHLKYMPDGFSPPGFFRRLFLNLKENSGA